MSDTPQEPQVFVVGGRRRRGRPPLSRREPSAGVNVRLPESDYDTAYKLASAHGVSVPEILRVAFKRFVADERGGALRYPK